MKQFARILALAVLLSIPLAAVQAADDKAAPEKKHAFSIGPVFWFTWWDPFFKNDLSTKYGGALNYARGRTISLPPSYLVGPTVSFTIFKKFSLGVLFVYGPKFNIERSESMVDFYSSPGSVYYTRAFGRITKYDLDTTLNYHLNRYVRVFAGIKVQGYSIKETLMPYGFDFRAFDNYGLYKYRSLAYGPGLGIGISIPLGMDFSLLSSLSAIYMRSSNEYRGRSVNYSCTTYFDNTERMVNDVWGGNGTLSVAYFLRQASLTFIAGGRYQYLKYYTVEYTETGYIYPYNPGLKYAVTEVRRGVYSHKADQFYGLMLSVIYTLDF